MIHQDDSPAPLADGYYSYNPAPDYGTSLWTEATVEGGKVVKWKRGGRESTGDLHIFTGILRDDIADLKRDGHLVGFEPVETEKTSRRTELLAKLQGQPWGLAESEAVDFIAWINGIYPSRPITIQDFSRSDITYAAERLKVLGAEPAQALADWQAKRADDERPWTQAEIIAEGKRLLRPVRAVNLVTGTQILPFRVGGVRL